MGYTSIKNESYEAKKIEVIHLILKNAFKLNQPRFYEIHVNDLTVVPKTDDLEQFEDFQDFITEETTVVKIFVYHYNQKSSDKYFLYVSPELLTQAKTRELGMVPLAKNEEELREKWEKDNHYTSLIEENRDLATQLEVANKALVKADKENKRIRNNRDKEFKQKVGDTLEGILESEYVKKNFPLAGVIKEWLGGSKAPAEENLSGQEDEEEEEQETEDAEIEIVHQRVLSTEEEKYLLLIKDIKSKVGTTNLASIMYLLDLFTTNPASIDSAIKVVKNYITRKPKPVNETDAETEIE